MTYDELTEEESKALEAVFCTSGSCACDGYYDSGCPACNPTKRKAWVEARRAAAEEPEDILR